MDQFIINGGRKLKGTVEIGGSKNAALPILIATLLTDEKCVIKRVPKLRDINTTIKILEALGKKVTFENGTCTITKQTALKMKLPYDLVKQMRASFWVAGPLLARKKHAEIALPGGCAIGVRPVDIHLKGFKKLGAKVILNEGNIVLKAKKLAPTKIILSFPSVGATQNLLMCASLIKGKTIFENIAREPEVFDLINALKTMGAKICMDQQGRLIVDGVEKLKGMNHTVCADRIQTGTFLIAGAITKGEITVKNCVPEDNEILLEYLQEAGAKITTGKDWVKIKAPKTIKPVNIKTAPFPGFATDLQAPWLALMTLAKGSTEVSEDIFENRFMHAPELVRMGANIVIEKNVAKVTGVTKLTPATVMASDLRGGAALVLAALAAKGQSCVERVYHIDRGYEEFEQKLTALGAKIKRYNPVQI
ncbi:MAG: UDP-N-acetylglucosamine 1-carboxyvinyltransferase [Elusimicrobiaceae bacterium]|nr:UDP-N-acetylglucosamine 1-carboxyvinyltransferase [Elusimicrobiaceae bacterium]